MKGAYHQDLEPGESKTEFTYYLLLTYCHGLGHEVHPTEIQRQFVDTAMKAITF